MGALGGGTAASLGTKKALDHFVDDDAAALFPVVEENLAQLASEYLLTQDEMRTLMGPRRRP